MNTPHDTGARIRRLRLVSGLGQVEFARRIGIATGSVSKLENGRMEVSTQLLGRVAEVLDCSPSFLVAPDAPVLTSKPWLRAYADASKRAVDQQIADLTLAIEFIEMLELQLIRDTVPVFHGDLSDDDEIETFALDVRAAADLEDGDVVANSIRAAERLGCLVLPMRAELGRHLGLSARANQVPIICVSRPSAEPTRHIPGDRQRFTVAHEIGHIGLHGGLGPPQTGEDASRIEKQAHRFAGAFLAPAEAMLEALQEHGGRVTLRTLAAIKKDWGISIKALVMRFHALGVIDADHARSLYKQISSRGWNKEEPVPVGNEQAIWLSKATQRWAGRKADPIHCAAEASGIGRHHLERWMDWSATGEEAAGEVVDLPLQPRAHDSGATGVGSVTALPVRRR